MSKHIWNGPEKRRYGRIELALTMHHRLCVRNTKVLTNDWEIAIIEDIGVGGLRFSSHIPYQVNDVIQIQIELIDISRMLKCTARVLRVRETLYKMNYSSAVEFINVHDDDMKDIGKIIDQDKP